MSDGQDHTGLGGMRIPLFFGAALFFFYEAFKSFHRIAIATPKEIIANNNATLITARSGGWFPNINQLEVMFGVLMLIAGIMTIIGLGFRLYIYLVTNRKPESEQ